MTLVFNIWRDPKQLGWVTWSILTHNPIKAKMYLAFMVIESLLIILYSSLLVERIRYLTGPVLVTNMQNSNDFQQGLNLQFLRFLDAQMYNLPPSKSAIFMISSYIICGLILAIAITLFLIGAGIKDSCDVQRQHNLKYLMAGVLLAYRSFLHQPLMDVTLRTMASAYHYNLDLPTTIQRYFVCSIAILLQVILMLYVTRIFQLCIPNTLVTWCSPSSKIEYLSLFSKLLLLTINAFDTNATYGMVEISTLFALQMFQAIYKLLFIPCYNREVDLIVKFQDFTVCLIFFIGVICTAFQDQARNDAIFFIVLLPFMTLSWVFAEKWRQSCSRESIKRKGLKNESDYEYALYVLFSIAKKFLLKDQVIPNEESGYVTDLLLSHLQSCHDAKCVCTELDSYFNTLSHLNSNEVSPLIGSQAKYFTNDLTGTISSFSKLTIKQKSSQWVSNSTRKSNRYFDHSNQDGGKDDNIKGSKVDWEVLQRQFLSELLSLYVKDIVNKFPCSFQIQFLSFYFSLHIKQKYMLSLFQLCSFPKHKLSKFEKL